MRILLLCLLLAAGLGAVHAEDAPILCLDPGGHTAMIRKVIFTPDGRQLISVGDDKVIRCWDTASGEPLRTLRGKVGPGPEGKLYAAALAPDGHTLAVGGYGYRGECVITLFDLRTNAVIRLLRGHEDVIDALAFSPDGARLVSGSADTTMRVWQVATGECCQQLHGHTQAVCGVAFSPDGLRVASASLDHSAGVWDIETGARAFTLTGHTAEVRSVAWSPDGKTIATGGDDQLIRLWDAHDGRLLQTLPRQGNHITCLAFSPDSRQLVSGLGGLPGECIVRQWSLPAGTVLHEFAQHRNTVLSVAFSPNGTSIAGAGGDNNEIYLWDAATGAPQRRLAGKGAGALSIAWSADGTRIAWGHALKPHATTNDYGDFTCSFDLFAGQLGSAVTNVDGWKRAVTEWDGQTLATTDDRLNLLIRTGTQETARYRHNTMQDYDRICCDTFTPTGEVVVGSEFTMALYDSAGRRLRRFIEHTGVVWAVASSPDGRYLASSSDDQTVRIWPLHSAEETVAPLLTIFHGTDGAWVAWTPEGYYACSPGAERLIGWLVNRTDDDTADYYPAYQFRRTLYRPDVICRLLEAGSTAEAVKLADAGRKKPAFPEFPEYTVALMPKIAPPKVELLAPAEGAVTTETVTVRARVTTDNGCKVSGVTLLVNGRKNESRDMTVVSAQQPADERRWQVTLLPGDNTISVLAVNDAGAESVPVSRTVTYHPARAATPDIEKPALYLLAIGVSHYADAQFALGYPAKDAHDFAAIYQAQQGKLFRKVSCKLLTDADASRDNIMDALDWLSKEVTQRDWAMVFVAGHGITDNLKQYYYAPYNIDPDRLKRTGVVWTDFRTTLTNLPGKVFLVLDTCHAAGVTGEKSRGSDAYTDMLRDAVTDEVGLITFASCMPREVSLENAQWKNGAFTHALVEALSGKADTNHDGIITLGEVDAYVAERVKELTGGRQHPTTARPSTIRSSLPMVVQ